MKVLSLPEKSESSTPESPQPNDHDNHNKDNPFLVVGYSGTICSWSGRVVSCMHNFFLLMFCQGYNALIWVLDAVYRQCISTEIYQSGKQSLSLNSSSRYHAQGILWSTTGWKTTASQQYCTSIGTRIFTIKKNINVKEKKKIARYWNSFLCVSQNMASCRLIFTVQSF